MATWQDKAEFVNQNSRIAMSRLQTPNNAFVGTNPPTMVTYYHINTNASTRDTGLQNVELIDGETSGNRFNVIKDVPLYGIPMMEMNVDEDESGFDTNFDGNFILPPHIFHPLPDDFFVIDHLNMPAVFRVTQVNYDTPNHVGFFRCDFELWTINEQELNDIKKAVVGHYTCLFDNIGTQSKSVVADDEFIILEKINCLRKQLRDDYLPKFLDKEYNALMFMRTSYDHYLYDPMLNSFCNREKIFSFEAYKSPDCYLMYEEKRNFHDVQYEDSFYDRISHHDITDLNEVGIWYDMEPTKVDVSVFDYNKDERVKYLMTYAQPTGPFNNPLREYIPKNFITALELKNEALLKDPYEIFVYKYMTGVAHDMQNCLELVEKRRIRYSFHSFIFIPLVIYCLNKCYDAIICDTTVMDEEILDQYSIKNAGRVWY